MTQLKLSGPLVEHFRQTRNRSQTVAEIVAAIDRPEGYVRRAIGSYALRGYIERSGTPRRYSFKPGVLEALREIAPPELRDIEAIRAAFCERWGVSAPFEATKRSPEALREWIGVLDDRR